MKEFVKGMLRKWYTLLEFSDEIKIIHLHDNTLAMGVSMRMKIAVSKTHMTENPHDREATIE